MRTAIVADIHGNWTALQAVLADLEYTSPDLILHGGDLAGPGSNPAAVVDQIRALGWPGVVGNTDEMLFRPESLADFARVSSPQLQTLFAISGEMAEVTREWLGEARLAWLSELPMRQRQSGFALVHASPGDVWRAPGLNASDAEFYTVYGPLERTVVVYGHIHHPGIRKLSSMTVANGGSVGLSYDGDARASYLLIDEGTPSIRRVAYDLDDELKALRTCGLPHADWIGKMLEAASFQMP